MAGRLQDKRCLIVGGTSGIGLAAARRFAEEGARIVIAGLDDPQTYEGVQRLISDWQAGWQPFWSTVTDVREAGRIADLFNETQRILGGLDVLFHVAGGSGRRLGDGALHECTDDGWAGTLDLNLRSVFLTNRAAVRQFLQQRSSGAILNTSSVLAFSPSPRHFDTCAYTAAKGAIIALSRQAAARYAADGIRVNVLAPGLTDTPMAARAVADPDIAAYLTTKQPLVAGPLTPEDCAEAAVFLCSDAAQCLTGVVLPVDAGWCVSEGQSVGG